MTNCAQFIMNLHTHSSKKGTKETINCSPFSSESGYFYSVFAHTPLKKERNKQSIVVHLALNVVTFIVFVFANVKVQIN